MSTLHTIGLLILALSLGAEVVLFCLQVGMLYRYKHKSFLLLAIGSTCIGVYSLIEAAPYFIAVSMPTFSVLMFLALALVVIGVVFGVWGTWSLFRRFGWLQRAYTDATRRSS